MRIIDQNGIEMSEHDPTKGYLQEEEIVIAHHEAVEAVEEQGHYEVIAEYESGGKDVAWVVDVPGIEARGAYDEKETVLRFIPFTEKELARFRIAELKQMLADTDFNILKIIEGASTLLECREVIKQRALWRKEINELEVQTDGLRT